MEHHQPDRRAQTLLVVVVVVVGVVEAATAGLQIPLPRTFHQDPAGPMVVGAAQETPAITRLVVEAGPHTPGLEVCPPTRLIDTGSQSHRSYMKFQS